MLLTPVFDTVIVPWLMTAPKSARPVPPELEIVISPPELLKIEAVEAPKLPTPVPTVLDIVICPPRLFVRIPELFIPKSAEFNTVITPGFNNVPELVIVPSGLLSIPLPPVFDIVMCPPRLFVRIPMPRLLMPEPELLLTVMVPELSRVPMLKAVPSRIPMLTELETVICPPKRFVMVPF